MAMNKTLMHTIGVIHRGLYRLTNGTVGAKLGGRPMVLLTTKGRKSGKQRTIPLQYMMDGDNIIVVASNGGNVNHPAWWHNIRASGDVTVQIGKKKMRAQAETANEDERARLWPILVEYYSGYQDYEDETERTVQVVILRPEA